MLADISSVAGRTADVSAPRLKGSADNHRVSGPFIASDGSNALRFCGRTENDVMMLKRLSAAVFRVSGQWILEASAPPNDPVRDVE
jgi:hypothetical protein